MRNLIAATGLLLAQFTMAHAHIQDHCIVAMDVASDLREIQGQATRDRRQASEILANRISDLAKEIKQGNLDPELMHRLMADILDELVNEGQATVKEAKAFHDHAVADIEFFKCLAGFS